MIGSYKYFQFSLVSVFLLSSLLAFGAPSASASYWMLEKVSLACHEGEIALSSLSAMTQMASLSDYDLENKARGSAKLTAKVIQIKTGMMRVVWNEVVKIQTASPALLIPAEDYRRLDTIRLTLIRLISESLRVGASIKHNKYLQEEMEKITWIVAALAQNASVRFDSAQVNLRNSHSKGKAPLL